LLLGDAQRWVQTFFRNEGIPLWLVIFGSAGQVIFTLRFVYQWAYSKMHGTSSLPLGFWIISIIGSATIISYGIIRKDPVLILGQAFGFVAYVRNIIIALRRGVQEDAIESSEK
ncbi:MAG: lipid-A-disaccharide synthase N-terminal domain-containing protein, partial [Bacteroidales bacterium]|nr:lipid-A-disaccharide synthase N-terminal domain-containing protein [Bacteroidales bacterium]